MESLNGVKYNPVQVGSWINKHIYGGKASTSHLKDVYPAVMGHLEENGIPPTEEHIHANAREIFDNAIKPAQENSNADGIYTVGGTPSTTTPPGLLDKVKNIVKEDWKTIVIFILLVTIIFMYLTRNKGE